MLSAEGAMAKPQRSTGPELLGLAYQELEELHKQVDALAEKLNWVMVPEESVPSTCGSRATGAVVSPMAEAFFALTERIHAIQGTVESIYGRLDLLHVDKTR